MYRKIEETCHLNSNDKLVITLENGKFKVLINNQRVIHPKTLSIESDEKRVMNIFTNKIETIASEIELKFTYTEGE